MGELVKALDDIINVINRMLPPDDQICNALAPADDGCGCSLRRFHSGLHEAHDINGRIYHTWQ